MNFTDKGIKALKPQNNSYEIFSDDRSGFAIRVSPKGVKTWFTRYKNRRTGKQIKVTIGQYPHITLANARQSHNNNRNLLHDGKDPREIITKARQPEPEVGTIEELAYEFIERHSKIKKKSWRDDLRYIERDVIPNWGDRKMTDITRRDIIRLLDSVVDRGSPVSANNLHARLSKMFRFAVRRGLMDTSPFVEIEVPSKKVTRDRVLSTEEIQVFWTKLETATMHNGMKLGLKLLLITGQRRGELAPAKKSEFDMSAKIWTIPSERAKNGLAHRVPLSLLAIELLAQLSLINQGSQWLIPSPYGEDNAITAHAYSRTVRNNRDHFGLERFTPHDLRRTAASQMTALGVPRLVVSKILNHVETGITAVYDRHSYDDEKREALNKWSNKLQQLINWEGTLEKGRNVI